MGGFFLGRVMKKEILTDITFLFIASIFTLTVYWNGLYGPPVFDDIPHIAYNKKVLLQDLDFSSLKSAAFSQKSGVLQRPIALLTIALNIYTTGTDTFWMKLTNLVIHITTGFGLFLLARFLLARFYLQNNQPVSFNQINILAGLVGILWLVHPLNLTSVLYIVQRMNQLSALFLIAALLSYIWGRTKIENGNKKGYWIIGFGYVCIFWIDVDIKQGKWCVTALIHYSDRNPGISFQTTDQGKTTIQTILVDIIFTANSHSIYGRNIFSRSNNSAQRL